MAVIARISEINHDAQSRAICQVSGPRSERRKRVIPPATALRMELLKRNCLMARF